MIKCGKCGKRYDYDKYNGICPSCGRYNRKDSAVLESELHDKYDQDPAHTVRAHEQVHEKNYDSYRHTTDSKRGAGEDFWSADKNPQKHRLAGILIGIIIVIALFVVGLTMEFLSFDDGEESVIFGFFNGLEDSDDGLFLNILEMMDGYSEDTEDTAFIDEYDETSAVYGGIAMEYAYMDELGTALDDVDWEESYYIEISDEDRSQMEDLEKDYSGGSFYLVTMRFENGLQEDFDLTSVSETDVIFSDCGGSGWSDVGLLMFYSYWENMEAGEEGYLECLIFIPDEVAELAEEEGCIELDIEYTTIQDGETYVNTYEFLSYYPDY